MRSQKNAQVLLVDDDVALLRSTQFALEMAGIGPIAIIDDSRDVMGWLKEFSPQVILLDLSMPHLSGLELLPEINGEFPNIPIIVMTAINELETAVNCMKLGAVDYLTKPVERALLLNRINKILDLHRLKNQLAEMSDRLLTGRIDRSEVFSDIVTKSPKMKRIFQYLESVAFSDEPVLISGETGVGKELIARALHGLVDSSKPLIIENVAGLDDAVFSDTLFGHVKGAFAGADQPRQGLVEQAGDGTLVLDEIGDLSPNSQIKLLRLIQERTFTPLGADKQKKLNARILVTTHRDLEKLVSSGSFRQDLYYRLITHKVLIPPLRERREDVYLLLSYFLKDAARSMEKKIPLPPHDITDLLAAHPFHGNIRELRGMALDAAAQYKGSGPLPLEIFHAAVRHRSGVDIAPTTDDENSLPPAQLHIKIAPEISLPTIKDGMKVMERFLVDEALRRADGNQSRAASLLGLTRQAFYKRTRE
ncbi:MAG: sigma-54-dependent Fis family transcriptional regulator [Magnetococcales bacterium]|nr:sigma-54-dependent Fis family transcriptional regulator [Magnetococcales bacterium]